MTPGYREAVQYLYDNLPIFQRVGSAAYKKDLTNTLKLCEALDNPQRKFRSIHVAGTNGKGSTSHMLASVLQSAGYKTGLYTSPHLKEFTERIKVNGQEVMQSYVVDFVERIKPLVETIQPSFFEITVVMAFDYFVQQKIDVAVIEVGLGGKLDSTNVIRPLVSLITNIGWDHKDILGDTLERIAFEKAGIIKKEIPIVVSERQTAVEHVFISRATEERSDLSFASDEYSAQQSPKNEWHVLRDNKVFLENLKLPLGGLYQRKNLPGVFKTIDVLRKLGIAINDDQLRAGLENVISNTNLKGRWQTLQQSPLVICDTGHNIDGIREVVAQITSMKFDKLHMVMGMVKDKDVRDILSLLPKQATYYFCQAKIPRAMDAAVLADHARSVGLNGEVVRDVNDAKQSAMDNASPGDLIFIGGSTFVVAELNEL